METGIVCKKKKTTTVMHLLCDCFFSLSTVLRLSFLVAISQWRPMVLPDRYIDHGAPQDQMDEAGLSAKHIAATVLSVLGRSREAIHLTTNP